MQRIFINDMGERVGETVLIKGWVSVRRDQGKMIFFDFRDLTGTVQGVVLPKNPLIEQIREATRESAVSVTGTVNKRPEKNVQAGKQNGDIELQIETMEILSTA